MNFNRCQFHHKVTPKRQTIFENAFSRLLYLVIQDYVATFRPILILKIGYRQNCTKLNNITNFVHFYFFEIFYQIYHLLYQSFTNNKHKFLC